MCSYLLKGNISGIQDFIFNVQSKGAAKTLKARSYYVHILSNLAAEFILQELPVSELFYNGGGTFFIEFESINDSIAKESVERIKILLDESQRYEDLLIQLSFVSTGGKDFWVKLRDKANAEKLKCFSEDLKFFEEFSRNKQNDDGRFPHIENLISKSSLNKDANRFKIFTEMMVKQKKVFVKLLEGEFDEEDANLDEGLINKLPFWKNYSGIDNYKRYRIENTDAYTGDNSLRDENIIDFDALGDFAAHRTGTNKIGILKLDVDNLGQLFGADNYENVKKYSALFSNFFNEIIYNSLYNAGSFSLIGDAVEAYRPNIYPIFSGGDDCFIIGSWDAVLCFANDLHNLFSTNIDISRLRVNDKSMTLSAGIVLVNPTYPVRNFAELAEMALSKAKLNGKNKVSIFGLTFSWDEYKHLLDIAKIVADEMISKNISRSYLDKIRKSASGFNALQNKGGADFDRIYKLKYYLSKNDEKLGPIVSKLFEPYYETLKNRLLGDPNSAYDVAIYPTITRIIEFLTKPKLNYVQ